MTAARLRKVGNLGVLVDPGAVVAITTTEKPAGVRVVLAAGVAIPVVRIQSIEGREQDAATAQDVEHVHHQLTLRST